MNTTASCTIKAGLGWVPAASTAEPHLPFSLPWSCAQDLSISLLLGWPTHYSYLPLKSMMTWTALFHITTLAFTLHNVAAAPFHPKRIAQVIDQSTALWEKACDAAGGREKCNPQSIKSFDTLLVAAGPCDQQNEADNMIDLAKSLNNDAEMIRLTQIFVQQPRNSPDSLSIPYCQSAPRHSELAGLYQCQFETVDPNNWLGGLKLGDNGTIPFMMNQALSPSGSCLAHPQGTIPDGQQLVNITQNPFANTTTGADSSSTAGTSSSSEDDEDGCDDGDDEGTTPSVTTTSNTSSPSPAPTSVAGAETIDSTLTITGAAASAIISALGLNTAPATAASTINAPSPSPSTTTVFVVGSPTTSIAPSASSTTTVFVVASESSSAPTSSAPALFKDNQNTEAVAFTTLTLFAAASRPTSGIY